MHDQQCDVFNPKRAHSGGEEIYPVLLFYSSKLKYRLKKLTSDDKYIGERPQFNLT